MKQLIKSVTLPLWFASSCLGVSAPLRADDMDKNLVKNPSFEVGTEGWGLLRGQYLQDGQQNLTYYPPALDSSTKTQGANSLRLDNPNGDTWRFMSQDIPVEPEQQYTFSFAAKAAIPGQNVVVNIAFNDGMYGESGKSFILDTQWQRYEIGPITIPAGRHFCGIEMLYGIVFDKPQAGSTVWLDAVQLTKTPTSQYSAKPLEIGVQSGLDRPYTRSSTQDYPVQFAVRNNSFVPASASIRYKVIDEYFKTVVSQGEVRNFSLNADSLAKKPLPNISPKKRGKYILSVDLVDSRSGAVVDHSDFDFAVIDSVKKGPGQFTDAFSVSGHGGQRGGRPMAIDGESGTVWVYRGGSADELFDFRAEAGDRWIRDWDVDAAFDWANIEQKDGEFNWTLVDLYVKKAAERGIRVMPVLGGDFIFEGDRVPKVPHWLLDANPDSVSPRGGGFDGKFSCRLSINGLDSSKPVPSAIKAPSPTGKF